MSIRDNLGGGSAGNVLDNLEEIEANTTPGITAGALAVKELSGKMGGVSFGVDGEGNPGYLGADGSLIPFFSGLTFVACVEGVGTSTADKYLGKASYTLSDDGRYLFVYFLETGQSRTGEITVKKNNVEIKDYYYQSEPVYSGSYKNIFSYFELECLSGDTIEIASAGYGMMMAVFNY